MVSFQILQGDCLEVFRTLPENSFDGCLCDPPYGLEFMGVAWDTFNRPRGTPRTRNEWGDFGSREHARKPSESAHIARKKALKFQEFSAAWATEVLRVLKPGAFLLAFGGTRTHHRLMCAIEDAGFEIRDCIMWLYGSGFPKHGSCLKPAWEPIIVARKSGRGLLNINACRIPANGDKLDGGRVSTVSPGWDRPWKHDAQSIEACRKRGASNVATSEALGRWPANVILDEAAAAALDQQSGNLTSGANPTRRRSPKTRNAYGRFDERADCVAHRGADVGGASRFFYCAKASREERGDGNTHPTVKPLKLTEYLARLILPSGSTDARLVVPFAGSGSEMIGAQRSGWNELVGIELNPEYVAMARYRITNDAPLRNSDLGTGTAPARSITGPLFDLPQGMDLPGVDVVAGSVQKS